VISRCRIPIVQPARPPGMPAGGQQSSLAEIERAPRRTRKIAFPILLPKTPNG